MVTRRGTNESRRPQELISQASVSPPEPPTLIQTTPTPTWVETEENSQPKQVQSEAEDLIDNTFNVQAHLLLHILIPGMHLKDYTMYESWNKGKRKTNEQLPHFKKIPSSTFFFFCNTIYIKAILIDFQLHWRGGGYQTLNSIFHSWANHVLFQQ